MTTHRMHYEKIQPGRAGSRWLCDDCSQTVAVPTHQLWKTLNTGML